MNKKFLIIALVLIVLLLIVSQAAKNRSARWQGVIDRQEVLRELKSVKSQYDTAVSQGYNSREIERLLIEAKQAFDKNDYNGARILLGRAADLAKELGSSLSKVSPAPSPAISPSPEISPILSPAPSPVTENPCDSAPSDYKAKCNEINDWLDERLVEWKPAAYKPMTFTVVDWPLQSVLAKSGNQDMDDMFLDAMFEINPDAIYLSILPQKYDAYKSRYDNAVRRIKEKNKILIISYNVAGKKEGDPTFSTTPTIDEYIAKEKQYTEYYLDNYKPNYFLVVVEPITENGRLESNWTAIDWKRIISETAGHAKTLNPNVKVGAIMTIQDFGVFDAIKGMSSLDVIGFNIYGNYRIYDEYRDAKCSGDCVGKRLDEIKSIGKEPWILETWENSYYADPASFDAGWRKEINNKWIEVMTYYAQKHGAKNIMPFFTAKFISEDSPFDFKMLENNLKNKERTSLFYAFKNLMNEAR